MPWYYKETLSGHNLDLHCEWYLHPLPLNFTENLHCCAFLVTICPLFTIFCPFSHIMHPCPSHPAMSSTYALLDYTQPNYLFCIIVCLFVADAITATKNEAYMRLLGLLQDFCYRKVKGYIHYIFASLFFMSKREHLWNKEECFSFHLESSFHSWDNQILTFQIWKCHDIIKCPSMKHETFYWII